MVWMQYFPRHEIYSCDKLHQHHVKVRSPFSSAHKGPCGRIMESLSGMMDVITTNEIANRLNARFAQAPFDVSEFTLRESGISDEE